MGNDFPLGEHQENTRVSSKQTRKRKSGSNDVASMMIEQSEPSEEAASFVNPLPQTRIRTSKQATFSSLKHPIDEGPSVKKSEAKKGSKRFKTA